MSVLSTLVYVFTVLLGGAFGIITILVVDNFKLPGKKGRFKKDLQTIGIKILLVIVTIAIIIGGFTLASNIDHKAKNLEEKTMSSLGYAIYNEEKDANIIIKEETFHMYYKFKK